MTNAHVHNEIAQREQISQRSVDGHWRRSDAGCVRILTDASLRLVPFVPTTFNVEVTGAGHAVVLIPGFACHGRVWRPILAQLTGVEAHVITFAGFAGVPPVGEPSLARIHADLSGTSSTTGW